MKTSFSVFAAFMTGCLFSAQIAAEQASPLREHRDTHWRTARPHLPPKSTALSAPVAQSHVLALSKAELAARPDLIVRALIPAVLQNNAAAVALLLPLYQQQAKQDPFLLEWAKAILLNQQGQYGKAVQQYRRLFSQHPDIFALRYQLAQMLFVNQDNAAAKDQFQKLRAEEMPAQTRAIIDRYLTVLTQRDEWQISGGVTYLNESNINNAPKPGTHIGRWTAWQRESAQGAAYNVAAEKTWSLPYRLFARFGLEGNGNYYWDNKKYNEFNLRANLGLGYHSARAEFAVLPFSERRWYAGGASGSDSMKRYSQNSGVRVNGQYWLGAKWQLSTALEYGKQRYVMRKHLNGDNYLWSNTLLYLPKSGQYWFGGVDYQRENTRDRDNAFQRIGFRAGFGQEWGAGISSRLMLSYAKRAYQGKDFFGIQQKNNEYATTLTLWHRNLHVAGMTPKLSWTYQKVASNHPFYQYDKNRLYLEIGKTF